MRENLKQAYIRNQKATAAFLDYFRVLFKNFARNGIFLFLSKPSPYLSLIGSQFKTIDACESDSIPTVPA